MVVAYDISDIRENLLTKSDSPVWKVWVFKLVVHYVAC